MKVNEFLVEYSILKWKEGPITVTVSDHLEQRASERAVSWKDINKIFKRIRAIKPQLEQMLNFHTFYLRDDETGVELGCTFIEVNDKERLLQINTAVAKGEPRKDAQNPVISVNANKINEIRYADVLGGLTTPVSSIIPDSKKVGTVDSEQVFKYTQVNTELYFTKTDNNEFSAVVLLDSDEIKAVKNYTKNPGLVTAIIGFIVHTLKIKLKISKTEQLTTSGFNWLCRLLDANGKGFVLTDQDGNFPDINKVKAEWNDSKNDINSDSIEINFNENADTNRKLIESGRLIMSTTKWVGDKRLL